MKDEEQLAKDIGEILDIRDIGTTVSCNLITRDRLAKELSQRGYVRASSFAGRVCKGIACHSDYHGDNVVSHIYAAAEDKEKELKDVTPLDVFAIESTAVKRFADWLIGAMENYENDGMSEREIIESCTESYCKERLFDNAR